MKKEMLINVLQPEECRIAIVENGVLEELYVERTSHESYTGNIYKGKVVNLEPAIQAAFVDFSVGRNGFLHVSDVEPQYYNRHPGDEEGEPTAGPPQRKERDRDRERDDRKRPRAPTPIEPPPAPPRAEDRPRERDRDRDRERERPDRSVRGRRDRSEMPREFGEGLTEAREAARAAESAGAPTSYFREAPPAVPPSPPNMPRSRADEDAWGVEREPQRERERYRERDPRPGEPEDPRERERYRERDPRPSEPEDPRWRASRTAEPFDPDLPPSRTQRGRLSPTPPESEPEERGRYRVPPTPPESAELIRERDEPIGEFLPPDAPSAREPRRGGRSRGRYPQPSAPVSPPSRPVPPIGEEAPEDLDIGEPEQPLGEEFDAVDQPPRLPATPRRRGGRAAIRSRGGDRPEPERPREQPPHSPTAQDRPLRTPAEPEPERYRGQVEPERGLEPDRERGPDPSEAPRERPRPHTRAGEPGYVPRRERLRGSESGPDFEQAPFDYTFTERSIESEPDLETRDLLMPDEPEAGPTGASARPDTRDGKRRRRRRGRRRDRERADIEPASTTTPEEFEAEFDELETVHDRGFSEPFSREPSKGPEASDDFDDFDLDEDDVDAADELDIEDEEGLGEIHDEAPRAVEEEIDPELEQEIRKEIEEIEELEREMGLRGPVEARPRRADEAAKAGRFGRGRGLVKPPIQEIFRRGDEVLVQVIKESIGTKGPTLSTYISIPGRYLVLMPGLNRVGVSRKIVDEGQRRKLREIMHELNPPKGLGFIVRTAGLERTKRELARDLAYLLRLWKVILRRIKKTRAPAPIYQESDMITRTIRDIFTSEIDTIWIDEPSAFERAQEFLRVVMPRFVNRIRLYDEKVPLFHKYGIEDEIAKIQRRHVPLPEGGSIVIDQTEALVAIDVNSGNFRVEDDAERTAYEMNLRAAREIARQLRLRDLGGVIVNDFIDMREERHRRGVERALREAIKRDRARTKILRMSAFGLIEMTRQRIRPSLKRSIYEDCPHCAGAGVVKTAESMSIDVMRLLALASHRDDIRRISVTVHPGVASYLNNRKRKEIARLEHECHMNVQIIFRDGVPAEHLQLDCHDANGSEVRLMPLPAPSPKRGH